MSIEGQGHFFTICFPGFVCFVLYLDKISGERLQDHWSSCFRLARAENSGVGGGIWPKSELIQAFMHVLVTCKNENDRFKNVGTRLFTRFLPL